jgi:hypothetical protein
MVIAATVGSIATAAWNAPLLGHIEADGYGLAFGPTGVAVPVASGNSRYRQDRSSNVNTGQARSVFTAGQMAAFEYWYYRTLDRGKAWFQATIRTGNGAGLYDCHFTESGYEARFLGGREPPYLSYWEITGEWEFIYSEDNQPIYPDDVILSRLRLASPSSNYIQSTAASTVIIMPGISP